MSCFCKHEPCVNLVKAYQNYELICTKEGCFEVVYAPKICVKQRIINLSKDKKRARIIIKIFNFEQLCFENISLINEIIPIPKDIVINNIEGLWCYNNGCLIVNFPVINELSALTIDYTVCFDDCIEVESLVHFSDNQVNNINNSKLKKCKSSLKL